MSNAFAVETDWIPFTTGQEKHLRQVLPAFTAQDCLQKSSTFLSVPHKCIAFLRGTQADGIKQRKNDHQGHSSRCELNQGRLEIPCPSYETSLQDLHILASMHWKLQLCRERVIWALNSSVYLVSIFHQFTLKCCSIQNYRILSKNHKMA